MSDSAAGAAAGSLLGGDGDVKAGAAAAAAPGAADNGAAGGDKGAAASVADKGAAAAGDAGKGAAAVQPTADEQRAYLTSKGVKADDLAKLSEADLKKQFDDAKTKEAAPKGAPEKYEPFKMPEGVKFDTDLGKKLEDIAREFNLPQDKAQKVADLGAELVQKVSTAQADAVKKVVGEWTTQTQGDKEIGGEKLQENLALARKVRDTFFSPEFRKFLNETGLGNHPELIRGFYRAGKAMSEDKFVGGERAAGGEKSVAERLYGSQTK